jgi:hypothetical protein
MYDYDSFLGQLLHVTARLEPWPDIIKQRPA